MLRSPWHQAVVWGQRSGSPVNSRSKIHYPELASSKKTSSSRAVVATLTSGSRTVSRAVSRAVIATHPSRSQSSKLARILHPHDDDTDGEFGSLPKSTLHENPRDYEAEIVNTIKESAAVYHERNMGEEADTTILEEEEEVEEEEE